MSEFGKILKSDFPLTSLNLKVHNSQHSSSRQSERDTESERPSFKSLHKSEYVRNTASTQRETVIKSVTEQKPIDARRYDAFMSTVEYDFEDSRDESDRPQYKFYDLYRGRSTERDRKFMRGTVQ